MSVEATTLKDTGLCVMSLQLLFSAGQTALDRGFKQA